MAYIIEEIERDRKKMSTRVHNLNEKDEPNTKRNQFPILCVKQPLF